MPVDRTPRPTLGLACCVSPSRCSSFEWHARANHSVTFATTHIAVDSRLEPETATIWVPGTGWVERCHARGRSPHSIDLTIPIGTSLAARASLSQKNLKLNSALEVDG